ncbi:MAG: DegV family protein [Asgard group archaeon]|nr:DegV family protein [Asgard group archaeon]
MSSIAIVTDGLSELKEEVINKYNIVTIPYRIFFGDEIYRVWNNDNSTLSISEFCSKLENVTKETFPHTSVPSPGEFKEAFDEAFKKADTVIAILLTSKMSGTVQAARNVVDNFYKNKDITIFDSLHTMTGVGNQALEAAKMASENKSKDEILTRLEYIRNKTRYILAMRDLDFLEKQGRLGPIKNVRDKNPEVIPTIQEKEGILQPLTMFNNEQDLINRFTSFAKKIMQVSETKDIFLTHINNPKAAKAIYKALMENNSSGINIHFYEACSVLGVYSGPNSISLSYVGDFESEWL